MKSKTDGQQCTSRVRGTFEFQEKFLGEYEFLADHIAAYIEHRTDQDGYGPIKDIDQINAWVVNADMHNPRACSVPPAFEKFEWIAAEMLAAGIGRCYCPTCRSHYDGFELTSGSSWGSAGWLAENLKCPQEHEIMKLDLVMPFCGHKTKPRGQHQDAYQIPAFLRNKQTERSTK